MQIMDEFVLNYTLERFRKNIALNRQERLDYQTENELSLKSLSDRTTSLETTRTETNGTITSLLELMNSMQEQLLLTKEELVKTKLQNVKQEITIRTLHNMQFYDGYDMYADTFTDASNIDWTTTVRGEWLGDFKAIGRTRKSVIKLQQPSAPSSFLISADGTSDQGICQMFQVDEDADFDRVSFYIEKHHVDSWRELEVNIRDSLNGAILTSAFVPSSQIGFGDWIDVYFPGIRLTAYQNYYLEIKTLDPYGYRIGVDMVDRYLPGTSYGLFNNVWVDNNYDMGFKIWCFPNENDAIIYTKIKELTEVPTHIVFEKEDTLFDGTINYHVSRDGGTTWKLLQAGIETNLNDLPTGNRLIIKAYIVGESRIEAWGYVVRKGDQS